MVDSTLKKELITHNIYSAWQFVEYTEKNIATVQYCADTIKNIIDIIAGGNTTISSYAKLLFFTCYIL